MKIYILFALILVFSFTGNTQNEYGSGSLTHEMTPEELLHKEDIGKYFISTDPPTGVIRNIAEFEQMEGVLVHYPFGLSTALIAAMSQHCMVWTIVANASQQSTVTSQYTAAGANLANCVWVTCPSNTYWTRDYGPWFIHHGNHKLGIVDFPYNRPRPKDDSIPKVIAAQMDIPWFGMNLIHTGGNYMTLGTGVSASSQLVLEENENLSAQQVDSLANLYLGINTYHKIYDPNNTYIDHIDCWGKYLAPDKVLIRSVPPSHPQYDTIEETAAFFAIQPSPYGTPFHIFRVYTPNGQPYTNSLILNNRVFVPLMGNLQYDTAAIHIYQQAMPGYEILGFTGSWESTDALHCRAIGLADRNMLEIIHSPLQGVQTPQAQYTFSAEIYPYSKSGLIADSVILYYKYNNGNYQAVLMDHTVNSTWEAVIPGFISDTVISYYIHAVDSAGNSANHPYIGAADPHVFYGIYIGIEDGGNPQPSESVIQLTPNPFKSTCTIDFSLERLVNAKLEIYNIQGQLVKNILQHPLGPGRHCFCWDGTNDKGMAVGKGMYLVTLSTDTIKITKKLVFAGN